MYLRPTSNTQGVHELWHLNTNSVIIRRRILFTPITQGVINMVHMLKELDNMPPGLKLTSNHHVILYESTWIPGVTSTNQNQNKKTIKMTQIILMRMLKMIKMITTMKKIQIRKKWMKISDVIEEIDPNELGDLLQDTCNKFPRQYNVHEVQEVQQNQQMISESKEGFGSEE